MGEEEGWGGAAHEAPHPPAPRVPRLGDDGTEGLLDRPACGPDGVK